MILTDGTNTYTNSYEDIEESPIQNVNTAITIGGVVKSQSDSQRLRITSMIVINQTDLNTLNTILTNFDASLSYTPQRRLYGKTSITALSVILSRAPRIRKRVWDGSEIAYHLQLEFDEII